MWMKLLQFVATYLMDKLLGKLWSEYEKDKELKDADKVSKEEINKKVKALKNAKTKEEIRIAINDLSL